MTAEKENTKQTGVIQKGMKIDEAIQAGGAYFFRVKADEKIWAKNVDPNIVIAAQIDRPDNSQIWMTFKNDTQYPKEGLQAFEVTYEHGIVTEINNLAGEG